MTQGESPSRAARNRMDTRTARHRMPEMCTRHSMKAGRHTLTCDRPGRATPVCIRRGRWSTADAAAGGRAWSVPPMSGSGATHDVVDPKGAQDRHSGSGLREHHYRPTGHGHRLPLRSRPVPSPWPAHRPTCPCPRRTKPLVVTGVWGRRAGHDVMGSLDRSAMRACTGGQRRATLIAVACRVDPRPAEWIQEGWGVRCDGHRVGIRGRVPEGPVPFRPAPPAPAAVRRGQGTGPPGEHHVDAATPMSSPCPGMKGSGQR